MLLPFVPFLGQQQAFAWILPDFAFRAFVNNRIVGQVPKAPSVVLRLGHSRARRMGLCKRCVCCRSVREFFCVLFFLFCTACVFTKSFFSFLFKTPPLGYPPEPRTAP